MNFLAPLGLLFGLSIPAVIILYLLKLKRIDQPISSTLLWRQSLEDLKANTPFQKLKRSLLLYLQLLIMALLALAIARPVLELGGLRGQSFVVLIDQSASMNANDVRPSRLDEAKKLAIDLVNDMSMGDRMMVASFSSNAQVITPFERNKSVLRNVIQKIRATENPTDLKEAIKIAQSASELQTNLEVVIFSDGGFEPPDVESLEGMKVRYIPIGQSADNIGITDLVVRRDFSLQQSYQVLVGVQNSGSIEKTVFVELLGQGHKVVAGEEDEHQHEESEEPEEILLDAREVTLAPGAHESLLFKDPGNFTEVLRVRVDNDDPLPNDNQAWAVIQGEAYLDVLLVTVNNPYLERALNLDARTRVSVQAPSDYTGPGNFDLVVFDAYAPPALTNGSYFFINAVPPMPGWSMGDELTLPYIVSFDRFHSLARYVNFDTLIVNRCRNMAAPAWVETIVESRETPLVVAFETDAVQGVVASFDLFDSNWPNRVSFPIFIMNLIDWIATGKGDAMMRSTGEVLTLAPPQSLLDEAFLKPPAPLEPKTYTFTAASPLFYDETDRQGIYEYLIADTIRTRYAVNLLSTEESKIAPRLELQFGEVQIEGDLGSVASNQEIWRLLALIAFIVLCVEWFVYVRRARYSF
ncbi:MAG: VWA domain-containing protein [Candidatus Hinthialibacter antarcticus]|nr:VWA domain-containing protein [Candidatus Hinthialibacter antarcticus]